MSILRDIENNVESNFSLQQQGLLAQNISESTRALEAQRHTLVQEATSEMIRRDAHSADTLSQLRSELRNYHLRAEDQSDEFQQSHTGLRQHLERSETEGAQFRNLYEETRTGNVSGLRTRHRSLDFAKSRDGVARTVARSLPGECPNQCSYESNTDYTQFDEYKE